MGRIVVKKRRTEDRKQLLTKLKEHQLDADQMALMYSTSAMQTTGLKKFMNDNGKQFCETINNNSVTPINHNIGQMRWRKRRKHRSQGQITHVSSSSEDTDEISSSSESDSYSEIKDDKSSPTNAPSAKETLLTNFKESSQNVKSLSNHISQSKNESTSSNLETKEAPAQKTRPAVTKESQKPPAETKVPAVYVQVERSADIEKSRLLLPIIGEEQNIIETIRYNDIVIVSGETGSGKTTQIPQFLYEAGYALNNKIIGITEPRRVAAVSMSERVARELNLSNEEVSYQIRFSGNVSDKTRIKFMTDGVLLRECQKDFLLSKYSVLIIDEAHERSVFSDILIGLLSRIVPMRAKRDNPLKLVIMSATLRVSDFTENSYLFRQAPPLINIEARQFPVQTHFAKTTPDNYLIAAYNKIRSIHAKLPKGGILVFVTSQMDVKTLCDKLKQLKETPHCLGLYAMLPLEKQRLVFRDPPEGKRLCVIATNVAETSITIPNIKYVVDTGLEKTKVYDVVTGVSKFITTWTSKSSAEQRKGRAGRVGPGHCYRLYSSAVFTNEFPEFSQPHILQKPVEDVLLQMKCMNIDNVVNFPFPTRPSLDALIAAEKKLILLGALDDSKAREARYVDMHKTEFASRPTSLGKSMSRFALTPRCAKMIVQSNKEVLPHVISLVSALTVREMFLDNKNCNSIKKKWAGNGDSKLLGDFMVMLRAIYTADSFELSNQKNIEYGLRTKAMIEIAKLRKQLAHEISNNKKFSLKVDQNKLLKRPTNEQCKVIRKLLLGAYPDHVARKLPNGEITRRSKEDPDKLEKIRIKNAYECKDHEGPVYISSESVLRKEHHDCIVYKELYQGKNNKMYMRDIAVIDSDWLNIDDN